MDVFAFLDMVEREYPGADSPEARKARQTIYFDQIKSGQFRIGQAFMNALRGTPYYERLKGTSFDPFYRDEIYFVTEAIEFLFR